MTPFYKTHIFYQVLIQYTFIGCYDVPGTAVDNGNTGENKSEPLLPGKLAVYQRNNPEQNCTQRTCFEGHARVEQRSQAPLHRMLPTESCSLPQLSDSPWRLSLKNCPSHHQHCHTPHSHVLLYHDIDRVRWDCRCVWEFRIWCSSAWIHEKGLGDNQLIF